MLNASAERRSLRTYGMSAHTVHWLMLFGLCVIFGSLALSGAVLLEARKDVWLQAERASTNLALALERDIARNIAVYDLSLGGAVEALRQPGIDLVSPEIRHAAVFDRAAAAEYFGSIVVLDAAGRHYSSAWIDVLLRQAFLARQL